jgi:undecaprenyl-diphosphatase
MSTFGRNVCYKSIGIQVTSSTSGAQAGVLRKPEGRAVSYLQAIVIALVQGVTELFPISSLGHSVLVPAWFGGSWQTLVTQSSQANSEESFYLAFIVALHCATALALLWYFRADWVRIIRGFIVSSWRTLRTRRFIIEGRDERLAWMIVVATIPVGLTGVALEHTFRTIFAKPVLAAVFLFINGLVLLLGERLRRRHAATVAAEQGQLGATSTALESTDPQARRRAQYRAGRQADARITALSFKDAIYVGLLQIGALFAGISRSGANDGRRPVARARSRGCRSLRVSARNPGDLGGGGAQASDIDRIGGRSYPRSSNRRHDRGGHRGLPVGAVPHALFRDSYPDPLRYLLSGLWCGQRCSLCMSDREYTAAVVAPVGALTRPQDRRIGPDPSLQ